MNYKEKDLMGMRSTLIKIFISIPNSDRLKILYITLSVMFSSVFDLISLKALSPLISNLSNIENLNKYLIIRIIYFLFPNSTNSSLLLATCFIFAICILFSALFKLITLYWSETFGETLALYYTKKAYVNLFNKSYLYFLKKNSSEFLILTTRYIDQAVNTLKCVINVLSSLFMTTIIVATLLISNFKVTFNIILFTLIIYFVIISFFNTKLYFLGKIESQESARNIKLVQESIGSIKDIILNKSQDYFVNKILTSSKTIKGILKKINIYLAFPRYMVEAIGIASILLFGIILDDSDSIIEVLPFIATLAFGLQKVLPLAQNFYLNYSQVRTNIYSLNYLLGYLEENENLVNKSSLNKSLSNQSLEFSKSIRFKDVSFFYDKKSKFSLKDINVEIKHGESIGIIGTTGSGKSTFIDILLGLIKPTKGDIFIDDINLYSNEFNIESWHKKISHVPQEIFLADDDISKNIAYGLENEKIDMKKVESAITNSQLTNFIKNHKKGFGYKVGERGAKLSGGQRQRLGIARALYSEPEILILDEATSALDIKTEEKILNLIFNRNKDQTCIMITHRETTLKKFDKIIKFKDGDIVFYGKPEDYPLN